MAHLKQSLYALATVAIMLAVVPAASATITNETDVNVTTLTFTDTLMLGHTSRAQDYHNLTVTDSQRDVVFWNTAIFDDQRSDNIERRVVVTQHIQGYTEPEVVYQETYTPHFNWQDRFPLPFTVPPTNEPSQDFNVYVDIRCYIGDNPDGSGCGGGVIATVWEADNIIP